MTDNKFATKRIEQTLKGKESYSDLFVLLGKLNQHMVTSSIHIIEHKLAKLSYSKSMISKTKLLGIEMLQNIYKHQLKRASHSPYFHLSVNKKGLNMVACNSVSGKEQKFLKAKLEQYGDLSLIELKELYLERLSNGKISKDGNAGLGILTIYNRSYKNAVFKMDRISENEYYFSIEVKLANSHKLK
jgi:hypothetical protein